MAPRDRSGVQLTPCQFLLGGVKLTVLTAKELIMSSNSTVVGPRLVDWSLTIGGCLGLAVGIVVLVKSELAPIPRSFIVLASVFLLGMGIGNLLDPDHPELSERFKFVGKLFAGFAIFSLSWAVSHP